MEITENEHINPYPVDNLYDTNPQLNDDQGLTDPYIYGQMHERNGQSSENETATRLKSLKWSVDSSFIGRDCASRQIYNLINSLGDPNVFLTEKGEFAMWKNEKIRKNNKNLAMFERIEVWDDNVISEFPFEHYASLIGYFKVNIPIEKLTKVLSMSLNVSYDVPAKTLKIRGRNVYDLIALTTLVCLILNEEVKLENIKKYKLVYKYMATLQKESKYYKKNGLKSFVYKIWQFGGV